MSEDTYAIGYLDCENSYFDDNNFNFEEIIHVCGEVPCLFLTFNKEKIHVYIQIPKVMYNLTKNIYIYYS